VTLKNLPPATLRSISPRLLEAISGCVAVGGSLARRDREGGTAPGRVAGEIARVRAWAETRQGRRPPRVAQVGRGRKGYAVRGASKTDLPFLERRIREHSDRGVLLPLEGSALRAALPDFRVLTAGRRKGPILGFGALRRYSSRLAEIRSLVVADGHRGRGLGRSLVHHLLDEARRDGLKRVFVLTGAPDFFQRLGFARVPRESLPEKVFLDCRVCPRRERCDEHALVKEIE
jgi:N-acetylglutamate synthase-like GNAT family acetyltransferase